MLQLARPTSTAPPTMLPSVTGIKFAVINCVTFKSLYWLAVTPTCCQKLSGAKF
ncbi:Uncharacterised protein [Vibrio cholerae]|nr:Uncharacterised protein [Vibrio cholerae]